jgi:large subunit ribosomal protein L22e
MPATKSKTAQPKAEAAKAPAGAAKPKIEKPKAPATKTAQPKQATKKAASTPVVKTVKTAKTTPKAAPVPKKDSVKLAQPAKAAKAEKPKAGAATKAAPGKAPVKAVAKAAPVKKEPRGKPVILKGPPKVQIKRGATLPKTRQGKQAWLQYTVDVSKPVEDGIMDAAAFEKFLHDRFKVSGKAGVLGDVVKITREKTKIIVTGSIAFSKRYLKYLAKKFLKKQSLRDWLRVVATSKTSYELRYYNIDEQAEGDEGEEEEEKA